MQSNNAETSPVLEPIDFTVWPPIPHESAAMPWWDNDALVAVLFGFGINLLVIALLATVAVFFARRLLSEMKKATNSLSAIVQHSEKRKTPARDDLASVVWSELGMGCYHELIIEFEHGLLRHGFKFGRDESKEESLPLDVLRDISERLTAARTKFLCPLSDGIIESAYSEEYVLGLVSAMRVRGHFVEMDFLQQQLNEQRAAYHAAIRSGAACPDLSAISSGANA